MKKLLLIRHGETLINRQGKLHRHNDRAQLTNHGRKQAQEAATICQQHKIEVMYSSAEIRAEQTAIIIAGILQKPWYVVQEFYERDWGDWQSLIWDTIEQRLMKMTLNERYTFTPPGGESWKQMEERLLTGLEKLTQSKSENIAVVIHLGAIRGLIPLLLGVEKEKSFEFNLNNGEVLVLDYNGTSFSLE